MKLTPRDVRRAFWRDGDLEYALHAGQVRAREMAVRVHAHAVATGDVKRALLNIARRWGKTYFFVVYCLEKMLAKVGARIPYAAMSEVSVREFVEPIIRTLADDAPPHLAPREYKGEWIIPASNSSLHDGTYRVPSQGDPDWRAADSRLIVKGCEDRKKANRLRGPAADVFVIDEAGFIDCLGYVVRSVAEAQLSTTDGMMLVGSSAPESPEHEFWTLVDEATTADAYMHATVYDAPHLSALQIQSFAKGAGGEHTDAWKREGLSERIVDSTRAVLPEFSAVENEITIARERPPHFFWWTSGDIGFVDLAFFVLAYVDFLRAKIVVVDEVTMQRAKSTDINVAVAAKEREVFPGGAPRLRVIDAAAITIADMDERVNLTTGERATKTEHGPHIADMRWQLAQKDDADAALNELRVAIAEKRIEIHPRCVQLLAHLRGAIWNKSRTEFARIEVSGVRHHFDGVDALKYLVRHVDMRANPYPLLPPGVTQDTHHIPPRRTDAALASLFRRP